jgi:hypothetical protein
VTTRGYASSRGVGRPGASLDTVESVLLAERRVR